MHWYWADDILGDKMSERQMVHHDRDTDPVVQIYAVIPNLVWQMRISEFIFLSTTRPQNFGKKYNDG